MAYIQKINVKYHDKEAGSICELPALYTEKGVVISHIRYLAWYSSKSESWKERSIFSLKLLLTYIDVVPNFENSTFRDIQYCVHFRKPGFLTFRHFLQHTKRFYLF